MPLPKSKPATWNQLRPVSLTDHFSKVAESFVTDWVMDDIEPQIDHGQFGSRKERSTTHYLVKLVDFILKHLERFKSMSRITVVTTRLAKARIHLLRVHTNDKSKYTVILSQNKILSIY